MATTQIFETTRSRDGRIGYVGGDLTLEYDVWFAASLSAAYTLLWATIPDPFNSGFGSLNPKEIRFTQLGAPDLFRFTIRYGANANGSGQITPDRLSFRIGANTAHVTNSLATLNRLALADMGVSGVNLTVDATTDTIVRPVPTTSLTDTYVPQASDVGQELYVTGGAGFTTGNYGITGITTSGGQPAWQLSASPAAAGAGGGQWNRPSDVPSGTNLTVSAGFNTRVTPDGYTPIAGDEGRQIMITGGAGFTPGVYTITGLVGGEWALGASPGAVSTAGGTWYMLGTGTDYGGAIGVSLDQVQGCEIPVPSFEFTIAQSYSALALSNLVTFRGLVGRMNGAPFLSTFPTGTLVYLGCEPTSGEGDLADAQSFDWWNLAHRFRYEPDVADVTIGGITVPLKPGNAYLWARYQPVVKGNVLTQPPTQVNVEQVLYYADFSVLGISL